MGLLSYLQDDPEKLAGLKQGLLQAGIAMMQNESPGLAQSIGSGLGAGAQAYSSTYESAKRKLAMSNAYKAGNVSTTIPGQAPSWQVGDQRFGSEADAQAYMGRNNPPVSKPYTENLPQNPGTQSFALPQMNDPVGVPVDRGTIQPIVQTLPQWPRGQQDAGAPTASLTVSPKVRHVSADYQYPENAKPISHTPVIWEGDQKREIEPTNLSPGGGNDNQKDINFYRQELMLAGHSPQTTEQLIQSMSYEQLNAYLDSEEAARQHEPQQSASQQSAPGIPIAENAHGIPTLEPMNVTGRRKQSGDQVSIPEGNPAIFPDKPQMRYSPGVAGKTSTSFDPRLVAQKMMESGNPELYQMGWKMLSEQYTLKPGDRRFMGDALINQVPESNKTTQTSEIKNWNFAQNLPADQRAQFAQKGLNDPASIREWRAYQSMTEPERARFLEMKRAAQIMNLGGSHAVRAPGGGISESYAVTPKPEDMPAFKGSQAEAVHQATAGVERGVEVGKKGRIAETLTSQIDQAEKILNEGNATGSLVGTGLAIAKGAVGASDKETQANSQLATISGWMTSNVPRMEGPQSDFDVENYKIMAARIGDRTQPIADRLAALKELRKLQENQKSIQSGKPMSAKDLPQNPVSDGSVSKSKSGKDIIFRGGRWEYK